MNTKTILGMVTVLVVVGMGIVFLGKSGKSSIPAKSITSQVTASVVLATSGFVPQNLTVKVGTTVTWTNNSGATATVDSASHPTHLVYPSLNLGSFGNGETLSLVFDRPGTYKYHNHLDASQNGTVVVE